MKLLILAIDAMGPQRVRALGDGLPALHALAAGGQVHALPVAGDPCSTELWSSFATGLPAQQHAVRGLTRGDTGELWRADALPRGRLPDVVLNRAGLTVGLLNLPVACFPPRPLAGWMACGDMLYPQDAYPPALADGLEPYPTPTCRYDWPPGPVATEALRAQHSAIFGEFMERGRVSLRNLHRLLDGLIPDVVIAYWHFLDSIQHHLLYDEGRTTQAYALADGFVGELCDRLDPERVVVVSDHGMRLPGPGDDGELVGISGLTLLEMQWGERRYLSSGVHTDRLLCAASWPEGGAPPPAGIHEVLPWALRACGLPWEPRDGDGVAGEACADGPQMTSDERETVLERLRQLGYG
jgi:hypothetical protein